MEVKFRKIRKETLRAEIPPALGRLLRLEMADTALNVSESITLMLCERYDQDPREFGLEPPAPAAKSRRRAAAASA